MAVTRSVRLSIEKGVEKRLKAIQKEIKTGLEKSFKEVYGNDKSLKNYYNSPTLQSAIARSRASGNARSELRQIYKKAWENTYKNIQNSYEQKERWELRKRRQKAAGGVAPYNLTESDLKRAARGKERRDRLGLYTKRNPRYRVRYTGTGLYTGFLRRSIAEGFAKGGNEFMSVSGDDTIASYSINVDAFPKVKGESYVSQYIDFLKVRSSFTTAEEIFAFGKQDQDKIAAFMVRMMENEFIPKFAEHMEEIHSKVNKKGR